jgi:hypothetical protein
MPPATTTAAPAIPTPSNTTVPETGQSGQGNGGDHGNGHGHGG